MIAKTGKEWYEVVKQHNSGTYNNQYMVLNYGIFEKNNAL